MKYKGVRKFLFIVAALGLFSFSYNAEAVALTEELLSADEVIQKANLAYYYAGADGRALVKMTITDASDRVRVRELTMLRKDVTDGGAQRFYVYFHRPPDVKGMVFMVWKNIKGDDDRWLYLPAIDLVKRVSATDKRTSFAGSHFTYEDVSGRDPLDDTHELLPEETLNNKPVYAIRNTPKDPAAVEFSYYKTLVDKVNFIPLRGEYFDRSGRLYKTVSVEEVKDVDGIPTVMRARVVEKGRGETTVEFTGVRYNIGLKDNLFTERSLRKPPRKWIK